MSTTGDGGRRERRRGAGRGGTPTLTRASSRSSRQGPVPRQVHGLVTQMTEAIITLYGLQSTHAPRDVVIQHCDTMLNLATRLTTEVSRHTYARSAADLVLAGRCRQIAEEHRQETFAAQAEDEAQAQAQAQAALRIQTSDHPRPSSVSCASSAQSLQNRRLASRGRRTGASAESIAARAATLRSSVPTVSSQPPSSTTRQVSGPTAEELAARYGESHNIYEAVWPDTEARRRGFFRSPRGRGGHGTGNGNVRRG